MDSTVLRVFLRLALRVSWIGAVGCSIHVGDTKQQEGLGTEGHECLPGGLCNPGLVCFGGGICIPDHVDPSTGGVGGSAGTQSSGGSTSVGTPDAGTTMPDSGASAGGNGGSGGFFDAGATGGAPGALDASVFDAGPPPPLVDGDRCLVNDPDKCSIYCLSNCGAIGLDLCREICCGRSVEGLVCEGVCVNLAKDPLNCGACGTSCDAGTCSGSLCTAM